MNRVIKKLNRKPYAWIYGVILLFHGGGSAGTPAFPGAEGFGRYTTGGRGGAVIAVTTLEDRGPGSLREAIEAGGPRTVVFRISGTISLESDLMIRSGDITVAGQTAPGDGICLRNHPLLIQADNVILRYLRIRLGDTKKRAEDAISCTHQKDIIVDHCSFSWGIDEVASFYNVENLTVQWCIISESLHHSHHPKGPHGYGGIWGGGGATFHHNLLAHHASRTPRFNGSRHRDNPADEIVDFRNNVIFNWGFNSAYGGEGGCHNLVANYYKAGPASRHRNRIVEPWDPTGKWYVSGNVVEGYPEISADNWAGGIQGKHRKKIRVNTPCPVAPVCTQDAETAYEAVLEYAGAIRPVRDEVDLRVIHEARTGKASFGGRYGPRSGIIDSQADAGGMPDDWEIEHGLDPYDPEDRNGDLNGDGHTNLEAYLNSLCVFRTMQNGSKAGKKPR